MNTTSKNYKIAQRILYYFLNVNSLEQIKTIAKKFKLEKKSKKNNNMDNIKQDQTDFTKLLEILESYSEKHINRVSNNIKKSFYLDFLLKKINVFTENSIIS